MAAHGLSSCGSQTLEHRLNSCGTWAQLLCGMWDLPGSGIEPVSPALTGGFFTPEPPGKPLLAVLILGNLLPALSRCSVSIFPHADFLMYLREEGTPRPSVLPSDLSQKILNIVPCAL